MKKKALAMLLGMAMVFASVLAGCSTGDDTQTSTESGTAGGAESGASKQEGEAKTYKIGMSIDTTSQAWRAGLVEDVTTEAEKHDDVQLTVTDADGSSTKQISDVEDLITKGVDAILISPIESQPLTDVCKKAYDQGIHVIVLDRELEGEDWTCFIGANNKDIGKAAGEFLREYMTVNGFTKLVEIQGTPGSSPCRDRSEPVDEALEGSGIEMVAQQPGNWTETDAIEVTENLLQAYPEGEIEVIYAQCDVMALGALKALKSAGREEIKIISIDGQKEAYEMIKAGSMVGTFTYPFPGAEGVKTAIRLIDGETVDKVIDMPSQLITEDNVDDVYDPDSVF